MAEWSVLRMCLSPSRAQQADRAAGHGVWLLAGRVFRLYGAVGFFFAVGLLLLRPAAILAAELPSSGRQLLPPDAALVAEILEPQALYRHSLLERGLAILSESQAFRTAMGSPELDFGRDAIQHFETEFGLPLPQIIESCAGEGLWASASVTTPPEICIIVHGREADRVKQLPDVALSLARKIVAGRGISLPVPTARSYQQETYYQLGDACHAVVGPYWLIASHPSVMEGMLDRAAGRRPPTNTGTASLLDAQTLSGTTVRAAADLKRLRTVPGLAALFTWPPKDLGQIILAGGWFDLIQRSDFLTTEISFASDGVQAAVRFPAQPGPVTPGVAGFFAADAAASAAPLLEPAQLIYSASWYRDYWKMWQQRESIPLQAEVKQLEQQLASAETGNLGYSAFDILRLLGPHIRFVVTRPGTNPYRLEIADRLPAFAIVFDIRDEAEFRAKVLPPIQRILGIVAITNKLIAQNSPYKTAEVSTLKFAEDPVSIANSARERYNFEPAYSLTRNHLVIGSTGAIVRSLIDELDRLQSATALPAASEQSPAKPGPTERQTFRFGELAGVIDDVFALSVRNAVLNDGLTIAEARHELHVVQKLIAALGRLQVQAGFDQQGFEYRLQLIP